MINKIYEKTKKYIINNYKRIILLAIFIFLCTFTLDYEVYTPGGIINIEKRIKVEGSVESKGSLNLTYVGGKKGIIPIILLSYIIPSWDLESIEEIVVDEESMRDVLTRNKILMKNTDQDAIIAAFSLANKEYEITSRKYYVTFVSKEAVTELEVGDEILEINGVKPEKCANNVMELVENCLNGFEEGENVEILVKRKNKEIKTSSTIVNIEEKPKIGIVISEQKEVNTNPKINYKYKNNESGSSGGLMAALYIYEKITNEDITHGDIISGTGSIYEDGVVGEIGGVKYKLAGAVKKKSKVFIVPPQNYEEAIKLKKENNYVIEIIEATTLEATINKLKNRK